MSRDGLIPSERYALATLDYLGLVAEVTDGVFRVQYAAHAGERADPLRVPRQLKPYVQPEKEPEHVSINEAFAKAAEVMGL